MQCSEIMERDFEWLSPTDSVQLAAEKMRDADVGFLPVCELDRHVIGAVTDRDIVVRVLAPQRPTSTPVKDVMSSGIISCRVDDDIEDAVELMRENQISRLVVCDDVGQAVGVISLADIAETVEEYEVGETVQAIKEPAPGAHH